jgi:hypothetical protein
MKRGKKFLIKNSQATIFIIIAILIVLAVIIYFLSLNKINNNNVPYDIQPVYSNVQDCLEFNTEQVLNFIGWGGGYINTPLNSSTVNGIPYYYDNGVIFLPTKEIIENEINYYLDNTLPNCYYNLDYENYEIHQGEIKTKSKIYDDKVVFNVDYPLTIKKNEKTYSYSNFKVEKYVRLGKIIEFFNNITNEQTNYQGYLCLSCINEEANELDFFVEINDYDEDTAIITIIDNKTSTLDNKEYLFNFALKYKGE